jgi:hypothetical protein
MDQSCPVAEVLAATQKPDELRSNFWRMTLLFALGHGVATTPLVFASSSLDPGIAYIGNGVLYISMGVAVLFCTLPMLKLAGLKGGLILGQGLLGIYAGCFALALCMGKGSGLQFAAYVFGSLCGGVAASFIWTAQGGYLGHTATLVAELENKPREQITAEFAGQFALYFLIFEEGCKLSFSLALLAHLSTPAVGFIYAAIAGCCVLGMTSLKNIHKEEDKEKKASTAKNWGVVKLWSDARIWLVTPINIAFGISAAFMNGYFNNHCAAASLGLPSIGFLTATTVLVAAVLSQVYMKLGIWFGNGTPVALGALSFALIGLLYFVRSCQEWNSWVVIFYVLQGSGRAVYESTNKAILADTFKGEETEWAFANWNLQVAVASALGFFLSSSLQGNLEIGTLIFAVLTPVGYVAKKALEMQRGGETKPLASEAPPAYGIQRAQEDA